MNAAAHVPSRLLALAAVAVALLALALVAAPRAEAAPTACQSAHSGPDEASRRQLVHATLCLLNETRRSHGLPRLRLNKKLSRAARVHARDMVSARYFAHDSRNGSSFVDRIRRTGYMRSARRWLVGENLAWGSGSRAEPGQIMQAWMNSPGHRKNILTRSFREIGIGVAKGAPTSVSSPAATYATEFGLRG